LRIANLKGFGRICEKRRVFRGKRETTRTPSKVYHLF